MEEFFVGKLSSNSNNQKAYELDIKFTWSDYHPDHYLIAESKRLWKRQ